MSLIWVIAFLGLLLVEFITVGLVSIWFAVGALGALITSFITESVLIQTIVFVIVSVVTLFVTKPLMKKLKITNYEPTNSDRVIGKVVEVTKEIKSNEYGEVVVFGTVWLAASDKNHKVGSKVVVQKIEGNKLIVKEEGEE
ncbi:MAG: NfeD family protein [Bacilli bacterium]|nr:NfeD family protein [Bacilli bacterium]MBQ6840522.1 NfeD family protein [Bacilli bacterium]